MERLGAEVDATLAGDPWYGPSISKILEGVDAKLAARRPPGGAHSVWELVLHMTAWTKETTRRLRGGSHGTPAEGDWPASSTTDAAAWKSAVAELRRAHDELASAVRAAADGELDRQIGGTQVDSDGRPVTIHGTLIGLLQHDAYHAGQISLLTRLLAAEGEGGAPERRSSP